MDIINIVSRMKMSSEDSTSGEENIKGKPLTVS